MKTVLSRPWIYLTGLFVGVVCLAYFQVVFLDRTLVATAYYPKPLSPTPTEYRGSNTFEVDLATPAFFEAPTNCLMGKLWRQGDLPLWNPYQMAGTPLAAQYSTRAFFPYQILENLASPLLWDYFLLGRLVFAGLFTALFLQSLGLSRACSFLGGIAYCLSGSFTWFINLEQFTNTALMIPICMLFFERAARSPAISRMAQASLMTGLLLLAGQPEIALWVILLCGLYFVFRSGCGPWSFLGPAVSFSMTVLVSLLLSAFLLLPFLELVLNSFHTHPPGGTIGIESPAFLDQAVSLLIPSFSELPTDHRTFPHNGIWDGLGGYTGVLIPFLILTALPLKGSRRAYLLFFTIFGTAILLKNFGVPPFSWIGYLPLFDQSWSPRWAGPVWTFCFACSAALGTQAILETSQKVQRSAERSSVILVVALSFIAPQARYVNVMMLPRLAPDALQAVLPPILTGLLVAVLVLILAPFLISRWNGTRNLGSGFILLLFLELWFYVPRAADFSWTLLRLVPLLLGLIAVVLVVRGWGRVGWAMVLLILTLFPFMSSRAPGGLPQKFDLSAEPGFVAPLREEAGYSRIISGDGILMPNLASCYGLFDVRYVNSLAPLTFQNYVDSHLLREAHTWWVDRLWFTGLPDQNRYNPRSFQEEIRDGHRYYSFLGVRYVLAVKSTTLDFPLVKEDEDLRIYMNTEALPRVFVAHEYVLENSFQAAQRRMADPELDLRRTVILEEAPVWINPQAQPVEGSWTRIESYRPHRVDVSAGLESEGILVLTDLHYPGWKAYVNGKEESLLRVNGLVRGIALRAGDHRITFQYSPSSFRTGLALSFIGLFLCGLGIGLPMLGTGFFRR